MDILPENARRIELTRGYFAIIDEQDFEWLQKWRWHCTHGYAARVEIINGVRKQIRMHREVFFRHNSSMPQDRGEIDHRDQDRLNNRLTNLRLATRHQNSGNRPQNKKNKSGYKGVNLHVPNGSWRAQIMNHGKKQHIGYYATAEEAALAYNERAKEIFGEFAHLNVDIERTDFTRLSNANNVREFRGVNFHKRTKKWQAYINSGSKRRHLGYFNTEAEALECVAKARAEVQSE